MIVAPVTLPKPPPGFAPLTPQIVAKAFEAVEAALDPAIAVKRLRAYFDPSGKYAGATFTDLLGRVS